MPFPQISTSPLAEGRELKYIPQCVSILYCGSPLAEGRELKCTWEEWTQLQEAVAPRGGA